MEATKTRFRFFLENAGYATPPGRAACALALARAEELIDTAEELGVARTVWQLDPEPWQGMFDQDGEVWGCVIWIAVPGADWSEWWSEDRADPPAGSWADNGALWGIDGVDDAHHPYRRVVRSEIASELVDELRQAIGDARDMVADLSLVASRAAIPATGVIS